MTDDIAQHRCSREQCHRETDGVLCQACERAVKAALAELPMLVARLHTELAPGSGGGEKVSGSRDAPAPLRVNVSALMQDIRGMLEDWQDAVRENEGYITVIYKGREGHRVEDAARWLTRQLDQLIHHPDGVNACDEIRAYRDRALRAFGKDDPKPDRMPAPCPNMLDDGTSCDRMGLIRHNGASQIICTACGRVWSEDEYERLIIILADANKKTA